MYNLLRLNQEEIENTNKPITSNETESVKKKKKERKRERTKNYQHRGTKMAE